MIRSKGLIYLTSADFIVRSAYQMGKTPLLPLFAASLGAGDALLGFILSVSTLTGVAIKPFVGMMSDRWGRRAWLVLGTALFTGMPFLYRFVDTPEQLFALRMAHGLATAVYGPVTLAYIATLSGERRAERLAWFNIARGLGYVVGPAAAGWMLLTMDPVAVFTVIGILSSMAFVPVLLLPHASAPAQRPRAGLLQQAAEALRAGARTPAIWIAGALDANMNIALYAAKGFLPIYALSIGVNAAGAGAFFAVQEAVHIAANPLGGRIADRVGYRLAVTWGVGLLGTALLLLPLADSGLALMGPAVLMGAAQALVFPSTLALVANSVDEGRVGAGMGLVGSLKNAGKVGGPVLAGILIAWLDFTYTFRLMGAVLVVASGALWVRPYLVSQRGGRGDRLAHSTLDGKGR